MHRGRSTLHLPRSLVVGLLAAAVIATAAQSATGAATLTGGITKPKYLLALGDSLAAGYQPADGTAAPPGDPATGYVDRGYPGGYAADLASERHLNLIDLACPGETTASMVGTPAKSGCAATFKGEFGATSQLGAAEVFLSRHRGQVSLITFDIGANDVDSCGTLGFNLSCFTAGEAAVTHQLPPILSALRASLRAADPHGRFAAMDYYDPFLAFAYAPGGAAGTEAASFSTVATESFNSHLTTIYRRYGVTIADVAGAFKTDHVVPLRSFDGKRLPIDIDDICRLTWMCPAPGSGSTANIHANNAGYRVIANAFTRGLDNR